MRPVYENTATLSNEQSAAERLSRVWNCEMVKLPRAYQLDFAAVRGGRVISMVEYKRRARRYDTVMLSMLKVEAMKKWDQMGFSCLFVVEYEDAMFYALYPFEFHVEIGGNLQRNDGMGDIEPVAMIPFEHFRQI